MRTAMVGLIVALLILVASAYADAAEVRVPGPQPSGWMEVTPPVSPPAMAGAVMAYSVADNRFVLFGGWDGAELGETWIFDPPNRTWERATPGESPPARGDAAFAYDSRKDVFVLFGGWYDSPPEVYHRFGDTWHFYLRNATWMQVFPSTSPFPRSDSAMAYDSDEGGFVFFGGFDGSRYLGETWRYDARAVVWTNVTPALEPSPRADGRMAYDSWHNRFLIFGGNDFSGPNFTFHHLDDTWIYFWPNNSWMEVPLQDHPLARDYAVFGFRNATGDFLLHGGYGERVILGDLWAFSTTRTAWKEILLDNGPEARFAAVGGYDSRDDLFLISGGLGNSGLLADTWLLRYDASGPSDPTPLSGILLLATIVAGVAATVGALIVLRGHPRRRRGKPPGLEGNVGKSDDRPGRVSLATDESDEPPR